MANIRYSHMSHWKKIPYKQIDNFRAFYYEDKSNIAYFSDWDRILRYHNALGYEGIEIAPWDLADMMPMFGSPAGFTEFAKERGVLVSGMFHGASDSHDKSKFDQVLAEGKKMVDVIVAFGGKHMNMCPSDNYFGVGPLSREQVQASAAVISEMGRYATDKGVMIGLHNEFFCAINRENHREFIDLTDPKYVHYCLDTAQIEIIGEDLLKFYDDYHERICTFHLKDTASPKQPDSLRYSRDVEIQDDGYRWFWEPGEGVLDFEGLWKLLKKYSFKGWMTIETDGTPDLLASMALTTHYLKNKLEPIYK